MTSGISASKISFLLFRMKASQLHQEGAESSIAYRRFNSAARVFSGIVSPARLYQYLALLRSPSTLCK